MNNFLSKEIIKHIFMTMGFTSPKNFGKIGMSLNDFIVDKIISIKYDEQEDIEKYAVYCGKIEYKGSICKVIATDISSEKNGFHEYIAVYKIDDSMFHVLKYSFIEKDNSFIDDKVMFYVSSKDGGLILSVEQQLQACLGFVRLSDLGIDYVPGKDYDELYQHLLSVIDE